MGLEPGAQLSSHSSVWPTLWDGWEDPWLMRNVRQKNDTSGIRTCHNKATDSKGQFYLAKLNQYYAFVKTKKH